MDLTSFRREEKHKLLFPNLLCNHMFILFPLWHQIHADNMLITNLKDKICTRMGSVTDDCKFCRKDQVHSSHIRIYEQSILLCKLIGPELEELTWIRHEEHGHPIGYSINLPSKDSERLEIKTARKLALIMVDHFSSLATKIGYSTTSKKNESRARKRVVSGRNQT